MHQLYCQILKKKKKKNLRDESRTCAEFQLEAFLICYVRHYLGTK